MIPGGCADERLDDQTLNIDEGGDLLGILAVQVGQEAYQIEVQMAFAGLGLEPVLIGHHEVAQTVMWFDRIRGELAPHKMAPSI
jgi:hypothetical protein